MDHNILPLSDLHPLAHDIESSAAESVVLQLL